MIQRLFAFILLCCLPMLGFAAAETPQPTQKSPKSIEERYVDGLACIKQVDTVCAQVVLAGLPSSSPYAKILEAQIAALEQDDDKVLRLLIPLQANDSLVPQATASLHATLALAYENQGNILRAIDQLNLGSDEDVEKLHEQIWHLLKDQPQEHLLELRGESQDTLTQGWIDLALAANSKSPASAISQWRSAYPDHPASPAFLQQLAKTEPVAASTDQFRGIVALLLPLNQPAFQMAAEAVRAGMTAAKGSGGGEIRVYATNGSKDEILGRYQQAITEGAQYIVGPMAREEVSALAATDLKLAPTLALNTFEKESLPENLMVFGLPVEAEAVQTARIARAHGMQSAIIVSADTPFAKRMEQAFINEWKVQDGTIVIQQSFGAETNLAEMKANLAARPADMIFLATDVEQARRVRPYLDASIPTFSVSHIYDGLEQNPENTVLSAIHFVDMPWMVNADHTDFAPFREAASKLPPGEAQRWFAVGVDAWHILAAKAAGTSLLLPGLSGTLHMEGNTVIRELPMAQFRGNGVELESSH